jgi:hypothetical protein
MIEHIFSVLCSSVSIDAETNAISLFKVLEQLIVYTDSQQPLRIPIHFEILSLWTRRSPDTSCRGKTRITYCTPLNAQKQHAEMDIDLSQATNYRSRIISEGLELTGPGRYQFVIELQQKNDPTWVQVANLPVMVIYQSPPPVVQPQ